MAELQPLRIVATYYDDYWHRQHFKGYDRPFSYCTVDEAVYSFRGEPECPIRTDVDIIEVDNQGRFIKQWQEAECGN